MIRAFLLTFFMGLLFIAIAHNAYQTDKSIKHCEEMIAQIHNNAELLENI